MHLEHPTVRCTHTSAQSPPFVPLFPPTFQVSPFRFQPGKASIVEYFQLVLFQRRATSLKLAIDISNVARLFALWKRREWLSSSIIRFVSCHFFPPPSQSHSFYPPHPSPQQSSTSSGTGGEHMRKDWPLFRAKQFFGGKGAKVSGERG